TIRRRNRSLRNSSEKSGSRRSTQALCEKAGDANSPARQSTGHLSRPARLGTSFDEPGAPAIRVHVPRAAHHRGRHDTRAGPALARVPSIQPRGTGRDAPDFPGGRPNERGPLPGGGSVRRDHPGATWVSAHGSGYRVPGRHRSRRVLVPRKIQVRIRCSFARSGTPWPKAPLPFRARPGLLLRGPLRGSDRAHQRVWRPRPAYLAGGLAAFPAQRVGRGTSPHPVSAPPLPELRRALPALAREVPAIQGPISRPAARLLPRATLVALGDGLGAASLRTKRKVSCHVCAGRCARTIGWPGPSHRAKYPGARPPRSRPMARSGRPCSSRPSWTDRTRSSSRWVRDPGSPRDASPTCRATDSRWASTWIEGACEKRPRPPTEWITSPPPRMRVSRSGPVPSTASWPPKCTNT